MFSEMRGSLISQYVGKKRHATRPVHVCSLWGDCSWGNEDESNVSRRGECIPACARPCPVLAALRYPQDILEGCFLKTWLWPWERHPSLPASGKGGVQSTPGQR